MPQTVLDQAVLRPFSMPEDLHRSAAVEATRRRLCRRFVVPRCRDTRRTWIALTFVRGLNAFQRATSQASAWFQTMKGASDFRRRVLQGRLSRGQRTRSRCDVARGVRCLAKSGAVIALSTPLLRVGEGRQAVDFLQEAPEA